MASTQRSSSPARVSRRAFAGALACATLWSQAAIAAPFPERPITIVVPYDPGGASDLMSRLIARRLEQTLGQPVIVENKGGANGVLGTAYFAKASPDGYTVGLATNSTFSINPAFYKQLPYDPIADFRPLTEVLVANFAIMVGADVPAKTLAEFIQLAKSKPGVLNASAGTANSVLADASFNAAAGIDVDVVQYKSIVAALQDLAAGRVQVTVNDVISARPYIDSGQVRVLAIAGVHRNPSLPDVPTTAEAGLPGFVINSWSGYFVPKGTPDAIVDRLSAEFRAAMQAPDVAAFVHSGGAEITATSAADFAVILKDDVTRMAAAARAAKIEPQ